ncbi:MAG: class I SAM-dependent methyltransferase [Promethearchaeota archaeon]|nr:MAG: class I SAM-dependent methyltransferase [Candidatus Lokiarchaeota archaeon]
MFDKKFKQDPKKRFSSRVEKYIKYRPGYPQEIIKFLKEKNILSKESVNADIGSGTGILSELFLKEGNLVYGVEPNIDMRKAGENMLSKYSNFISIDGSAEDTTLKPKTIDIIAAGQAFHWFNLDKTKLEFQRILKPESWVVLIWNRRKKEINEFLKEYEKFLLKYGTDYKAIEKSKLDFEKFFGGNQLKIKYQIENFDNFQIFDYEGLEGRLLSTSYIPLDDNPKYNNMISDLKQLFKKHQKKGFIRFEYKTEVIYGQLT